jgi:hypothetical protein
MNMNPSRVRDPPHSLISPSHLAMLTCPVRAGIHEKKKKCGPHGTCARTRHARLRVSLHEEASHRLIATCESTRSCFSHDGDAVMVFLRRLSGNSCDHGSDRADYMHAA